jgi:hypothetical protein
MVHGEQRAIERGGVCMVRGKQRTIERGGVCMVCGKQRAIERGGVCVWCAESSVLLSVVLYVWFHTLMLRKGSFLAEALKHQHMHALSERAVYLVPMCVHPPLSEHLVPPNSELRPLPQSLDA